LAIELVVENGAHRAVGRRADLDRPCRGGFEEVGAEWSHQPHDPKSGAEALLGRCRLAAHRAAAERPAVINNRN